MADETVKPRPKVTAEWDGSTWKITILDDDGKKEISPRQRNLLLKQLNLRVKRRYRELRVKAAGERIAAAAK